MDQNASMEEGKVSKYGLEFMKSVSDKNLDLLRPSARCFSMFKGYTTNNDNDKYTLIRDDADDFQQGIYDKPLPCFGCGVGWFSFLLGFAFPLMWYYATFLYFGNYYKRDPRERAGLAASAIAAMGFSVIVLIIGAILLF
ncbi:uncharacterized protein LOC111919939 isoform X1 [Lactuca sativa]|uniref:uncharacterized protein LOC111919939 isoform X1 n=1 Tax=Lactuca sativa TaxID=4236 RepID=UPI000CD8F89E|nr:uncharacterized protein LOC111919939 isoform X1 [Lactuca sativa]XP_023771268.1 uncharacterized protein LOC111919939 isoform X1 [Lactuca sativa]XP_023771269.1 uncharacterized protein LOC111919939 isoform X1 [Lactuca sativa]